MVRTAVFAVLLFGASLRAIAPAGQSAIREPLEVARVLAARYPAKAVMSYIPALSWSGALRLSALTSEERWRERARQQMMPFVSGEKPSIAEPYTLASLAGHFALFDFGEVAAAREAADFILSTDDAAIVRFARGWTDDMFMASCLLSRVASKSSDDRYARTLGRLLTTYGGKLQRKDGLFIHAADSPHAWGRGNGFAAIGLVEALTYLPESWPDRGRVLEIYRRHMRGLSRHQSDDGAWRQVVDEPTSYRELTVTAMTTAAMARGVRLGWLDREFVAAIDRGWRFVAARVAEDGTVRDVCSSTGAGPTKEHYLNRPTIDGADDRGGAMAILAALEIEELRRRGR
jgi:unsaturated rhamnogalacturonyl hydrolase